MGDAFINDNYGNLIEDKNKGFRGVTYNHLNLPKKMTFGSNKHITYLYNALGQKLQKKVTDNTTTITTDYQGGFHYENYGLKFFATAEGYVNVSAGRYNYVYNYTDHLGNVRLSYTSDRLLGVRVIEENNYYPFGLKHNGYNNISPPNSVYKYKFNGMELQDELGLNVYDFGARNYMPDLGRWANIDPLAEQSRRWTPYNYAYNNPVYFIDPDGMQAMSTGYGSVSLETSNIAIEFTSFGGLGKSNGGKEENKNNLSAANTGAEPISNSGSTSPVDAEYTLPVVSLELVSDTKAFENFVYANSPYYAHMFMSSGASGSGWLSDVQYGLDIVGSSEIPIASQVGDVLSAFTSFYEGDYGGGLLSLGGTVIPGLSQAKLGARVAKGTSRGFKSLGAAGKGFNKVLQSGGQSLKPNTLKVLNLTKDQGRNAIHGLKKELGLPNNFHGKIMNNGDYLHPSTGEWLGNLFDYAY